MENDVLEMLHIYSAFWIFLILVLFCAMIIAIVSYSTPSKPQNAPSSQQGASTGRNAANKTGTALRNDLAQARRERQDQLSRQILDDLRRWLDEGAESYEVLLARTEYRLREVFGPQSENNRFFRDYRYSASKIVNMYKAENPQGKTPQPSRAETKGQTPQPNEMKVLFNGIFVTPEQYQILASSRAVTLKGKELLECLQLLAERMPEFAEFRPKAQEQKKGAQEQNWQFAGQSAVPRGVAENCRVLGLSPDALDADTLKKAYRSMCIKYHPDKNKTPAAKEIFARVNEAYQSLALELNRRSA